MTHSRIRAVQVVVTLWLLIGVTAALAPVTPAQSVSGKAYGAFVQGPGGTQQSALALLPAVAPADGAMAAGDADELNLPGTITTEGLTGTTSGSIGDATAVQSVATVFNVNLIHVYRQSLTGGGCTLLGCVPSVLTTTGEIIVGSAASNASM